MKRLSNLLFILILVSSSLIFGQDTAYLVDDFSSYSVGSFPSQYWELRDDDGRSVYQIQQESQNKFLRARSTNDAFELGMQMPFNVQDYPIIKWSWRVNTLPTGADESVRATNDSAAAVIAVFPGTGVTGAFGVPRSIKYVWSTTLAQGTRTYSPHSSDCRIIVLESGSAKLGRWIEESVNVYADYKEYFEEEPPQALGIAVMSDSDSTETTAEADYDNIRIDTSW